MDLRTALQGIYDQHQQLTPAIVVDEARDETHPLHNRFDWNDATAGEAWRRQQAHELIRSVRVVYREADDTNPQKSVRAFHAVRRDTGHVYEPVDAVLADDFTKRLVLADMEREWKALHRRYQDFAEFAAMIRRDIADEAA
jgi:hypothetical protein